MIAEGVILHVDADEIIQTRCRETQNAGNFFGMEQIGGLVPVNPHASKVVAQEIVEGIPREETEAIRDPICFISHVVIVCFRLASEVSNRVSPLLIGARPDSKGNAIERVLGIVLKYKRVVQALRLASASDQLDVMREACLKEPMSRVISKLSGWGMRVNLHAWPRGEILPFHCPVRYGGCCPKSLADRID